MNATVQKKESLFYLLCLIICGIFIAFSFSLTRSFWLDETFAGWICNDTFQSAYERALNNLSQSPFYFLMLQLWGKIAGLSEASLRLPSLISFIISLYFIYKIAKEIADTPVALLAVLIFLLRDGILDAAFSAKAYSLGLSLTIISTYFFLKWTKEGGLYGMSVWLLTLFTAAYLHYTFIIIIIFHLGLYLVNPRKIKISELVSCLILAALLSLPLCLHFANNRHFIPHISYTPAPNIFQVLHIFSPQLLLALLCALGLTFIFSKNFKLTFLPNINKKFYVLLIVWWLLPFSVSLIYAELSTSSYFLAQYILTDAIAWALLFALLISAIQPLRLRLTAVTILTLFGLHYIHGNTKWLKEDWRFATHKIAEQSDKDSPVLVYSGYAEAEYIEILTEAKHREYLLSPFSYYTPVIHSKIIPIPSNFTQKDHKKYFIKYIEPALNSHDKIYLIVRKQELPFHLGAPTTHKFVNEYMADFFKQKGYAVTEIPGGGRIKIFTIKKSDQN